MLPPEEVNNPFISQAHRMDSTWIGERISLLNKRLKAIAPKQKLFDKKKKCNAFLHMFCH